MTNHRTDSNATGTNCDLGQRLDFAKGMSYLPSADCAHACSGDLTKACGAETIALVYSRNASQPVLIPDGSRAKTAPVTQQAVSKSGRWAYSGCRLGGFTSTREIVNTVTSAGCAATCDGYPQFALAFGQFPSIFLHPPSLSVPFAETHNRPQVPTTQHLVGNISCNTD